MCVSTVLALPDIPPPVVSGQCCGDLLTTWSPPSSVRGGGNQLGLDSSTLSEIH